MSIIFPSVEWLKALEEKLNSDEQYGRIARNWEGDMAFVIEPEGNLNEKLILYIDLWHGKCQSTAIWPELGDKKPAFLLKAPYENFCRVLQGKLDPMQAMLTRKLQVQGNMAVMMRSVPIVLDFVRCCREITSDIL